MRIIGFVKDRAGRHIQRRKTGGNRLKRLAETHLFNAAAKNQKVMATLLGKYGNIWMHDDDGMEAMKQRIRDVAYRGAVQQILTNKKRELDYRITDIINRVIPGSNETGGGLNKASPLQDPKPDEKSSSSDVTRGYRTPQRRFKDRPSLLTVLEGLASVVALAKLAGNQGRRDGVGSREETYVVRLGERMVEMTEKDYRTYINRQKGTKKASPHNPGRLLPLPPNENDNGFREV